MMENKIIEVIELYFMEKTFLPILPRSHSGVRKKVIPYFQAPSMTVMQ